MIFECGIISYLGSSENTELRKERWVMQVKQLEWLKKISVFKHIWILTMEWSADEKSEALSIDSRISCIDHPKVPCGDARNVILKDRFYKSDSDFILMLDNDCILYEEQPWHCSGPLFFDEMVKAGIEAFKGVDVIIPHTPQQAPFRHEWERNIQAYEDNLILKLVVDMKPSFMIQRNFAKYNSSEEYYDAEVPILENHQFNIILSGKGYGSYTTQNMILKEMATKAESTTIDYEGDRKASFKHWLTVIYDKWKGEGMAMKDGKVKWQDFIRRNHKIHQKKKKIVIPKETKKSQLERFF